MRNKNLIRTIIEATPNNNVVLFNFKDTSKMQKCLEDFKEVYKDKKIVEVSHSCDDYENEVVEKCDIFLITNFERYLNIHYGDMFELITKNSWRGLNMNAKIICFGCEGKEFTYSLSDDWVMMRTSIYHVACV